MIEKCQIALRGIIKDKSENIYDFVENFIAKCVGIIFCWSLANQYEQHFFDAKKYFL